jgi:serine protease Do
MKCGIAAALLILATILAVQDRRTPYGKAVESTVWIECGEGHGTGVFVDDGRHILTAFHVIDNQPVIRFHPAQQEQGAVATSQASYTRWQPATVVAANPGKDLALLRVEGGGRPMTVARGEPSPGDPLFAIGCGDGASLFGYSEGCLRQAYQVEIDRPRGPLCARVLDMSVPVNMGDSGGPVVDGRGELVGIISTIDCFRNQAYLAISASEIRAFLHERK